MGFTVRFWRVHVLTYSSLGHRNSERDAGLRSRIELLQTPWLSYICRSLSCFMETAINKHSRMVLSKVSELGNDFGFRLWCWLPGLGLESRGLGSRVQGFGFMAFALRVSAYVMIGREYLEFRVQGQAFRV